MLRSRRFGAAVVTLSVIAGFLIVGPAAAAGTATVSGTLTHATDVSVWDESVAVVVQSLAGDTVAEMVVPSSGVFSIQVPPGEYRLFYPYYGTSNYLSVFRGDVFFAAESPTVTLNEGDVFDGSQEIPRGGRISGTVTGAGLAAGELDELQVEIHRTTYGVNVPIVNVDRETGTYQAIRLEPDTYRLEYKAGAAWSPEFWQDQTGVGDLISVGASADVMGLDVELDRVTTVSGRVTAYADGSPIVLASVGLYAESGTLLKAAGTDVDGYYNLYGMPAGTYRVCATKHGRFEECVGEVTVAEGEQKGGVDFVLQKPATLSGTVTALDSGVSAPFTTGAVALYRETEDGYVRWSSQRSEGSGGSYSFTGLRPGNYIVEVRDPAHRHDTEYWQDQRYISGADPITVEPEENVSLGAIELTSRSFDLYRIAGADRFETGVKISQEAFWRPNQNLPVVYIANGLNYPDALSAGPAAIVQGGAVLLVAPDHIPDSVLDELERLNPERIVVAGSSASVSDAVLAQLIQFVDSPSDVDRIGGSNRYETSELIVRDAFDEGSTEVAFFVTGRNYPDALASGPAAAHLGGPVILVDGSADQIPASTRQLMSDLGIVDARIAGSVDSVSLPVARSLFNAMIQYEPVPMLQRYNGASRYDTAAFVNEGVFSDVADYEAVVIASGAGFADALAGGTLAGAWDGPLYLSQPTCIPEYVLFDAQNKDANLLAFLGGTNSLSDAVYYLDSYC